MIARDVGDSILSLTIWIGKRATIAGRLPRTATIRSLVSCREMRPLASLDPSAFLVTHVVKLPTGRLEIGRAHV